MKYNYLLDEEEGRFWHNAILLFYFYPEKKAVFLKLLDDVVAEEKGTVTLKCEASKPRVAPVWRKNGTVVEAGKKYEFLHDGKTLGLIVHDITQADAGEYSCDLGTDLAKSRVTVRGMTPSCYFTNKLQ